VIGEVSPIFKKVGDFVKEMKTFLGRDSILNAPDLTTEDVEVPEWGGWVRVRALSGKERDIFEASVTGTHKKNKRMNLDNVRARLVQMTIVGEDGQPLFKRSDIEALGKKSAAALDRVFEVATRLSGISEADVDELTENFD